MRLEAKVPVHIFSLSEKAAREAHTTHREALFEHNRSAMMRIYPFAFRVTSSNLDPSFYWRRGAQLVALNWQNLDKGMMLNHGMFVGTPGWELKPLGYRSQASSSNVIRLETLDLTIQVFAAQNLSLPEDDHSERWFRPYVNCQLHVEEPEDPAAAGHDDASTESEKSSYRRCTKSSSGCNPDFDGQKLTFPTVAGIMEELSFVRLVLSSLFFRFPVSFLQWVSASALLQLFASYHNAHAGSSLHPPVKTRESAALSRHDSHFGVCLHRSPG